MDAIKKVFADRRREGVPVLITFVTGGYPSSNDTATVMLAMQKGGADIIELGVPFSEPTADGLAIQETYKIALQHKTDYSRVLGHLREARSRGLTIPVVLMGYSRPFLEYGEDKAIRDARDAGANGFILVDLPLEKAIVFRGKCIKANMSYIPLIAPSTSVPLIGRLSSLADSFIYVISRPGKTGSSVSSTVNPALPEILSRVRQHASVPLAVGFGIATRDHCKVVASAGANAVVIGSRLVGVMKSAPPGQLGQRVEAYCREVSLRDRTREVVALPNGNAYATMKMLRTTQERVRAAESYAIEHSWRDSRGILLWPTTRRPFETSG